MQVTSRTIRYDPDAATSCRTRKTEGNEEEGEEEEEEGRVVAADAHVAAFDTGSILKGLTVPGEREHATWRLAGRQNPRAHARLF